MRVRERRRIEKRARVFSSRPQDLWREFSNATPESLLALARQKERGWLTRSEAVKIFAPRKTPAFLLDELWAAQDETGLWEAALTLEAAGGPDVIDPLIGALQDPHPIRRQVAVRALGWNVNCWNRRYRGRVARAILTILNDPSQPQPVRSEACESLAYLNWHGATSSLVAASREADVKIRFWATFGLGGMRDEIEGDLAVPAAIQRLKELLDDHECMPGWWSIRHEALNMLANAGPEYRQAEEEEKRRIWSEPNASEFERRWAGPQETS